MPSTIWVTRPPPEGGRTARSRLRVDQIAARGSLGRLQEMHLLMSTFAVEKVRSARHLDCGSETALDYEVVEMRIVETGAAGVIAIASQILIIAAVLL